jgi:hypothetical protein
MKHSEVRESLDRRRTSFASYKDWVKRWGRIDPEDARFQRAPYPAGQKAGGRAETGMAQAEEGIMQREGKGKKIEVEAYSGYKANERPLCFVVDHKRRDVKRVLDRWTGRDHDYFKVFADDGQLYVLRWHRSSDTWLL